MTRDTFIEHLEDYLADFDGDTPLPGRVRDAVHAELPRTRQVRPRPGPLGVLTMLSNNTARFGLAAAAVVVALGLGAVLLNGNGGRAGPGAASPSPSPATSPAASPSPTPSAAAQPPPLKQAPYVACDATDKGKSCLKAGTYQLTGGPGVWPVRVTLDVPAGWFEWDPSGGTGWDTVLVDDGGGTDASGWGVMFTTVGDVPRDPCDPTRGTTTAAQVDTPQKLAAAIATWPKFKATAPQAITVDGHSGLEFQLSSTQTGSCESTGSTWRTTLGTSVDVYPMVNNAGQSYAATVKIVDTGHGLLVLRATDFPQTTPAELGDGMAPNPTLHATDQAEMRAIMDSVRLTPW